MDTKVTEALDPIASALRHDGYDLQVLDASDRLSLRIVALEGACEDCLVPEDAMVLTVCNVVDGYAPEQVSIEYPKGAAPH
jgi:Fe-S cluster biogenesis protein NfuA